MTNSGAYPADFQAPKSLDGWGTQQCAFVSLSKHQSGSSGRMTLAVPLRRTRTNEAFGARSKAM